MPATTLRIQDTATGLTFRQWVATPSADTVVVTPTTDTTVDITVVQTVSAAPPNPANTLNLVVASESTTIISYPLDPTLSTQTATFVFAAAGQAGATPKRCGTVEIRLRATRGTPGAYDVETDGNPNTPPTGFTSVLTRGWVRGDTSLVEDISNTSPGGAPTPPAAHDESLFVRTVCGVPSFNARALTVALSHGGVSGSTNSDTSATRDATFANVVDDRFAAAVTTVGMTVTVPNHSVSGVPDWTFVSTTDDTIDVDPRNTAAHHFQVNDNVFDTTANEPANEMRSVDSGFLWTRITNARGVGVNGLTVTQSLDPQQPGVAVSGSSSTATRDGEPGWTDVLEWTVSKPPGFWDKSVDVTAPSDIDDAAYLLSGTDTLLMLARNDDYTPIGGLGPLTASADDHWTPGAALLIGAALFDTGSGNRRALVPNTDTGRAPTFSLGRFSAAGQIEYLKADLTGWEVLADDDLATMDEIALVRADLVIPGANTRTYVYVVTDTSTFETTKVFCLVFFQDDLGNRYHEHFDLDPLGAANPHSAWTFDPAGLYK